MLGGYLRVVTVGLLDMKSGCSAEIVALSPPAARVQPQPVSVAVVRILTTGYNGTNRTMRYLRLNVDSTVTLSADGIGIIVNSTLLGIDNFGADGSLFYSALRQQSETWAQFAAAGTVATLPGQDRRYGDMALALLTQYLNVNRGLTPEYGAGKFHNTRNEFLPMDTQALVNALLCWGKHAEAQRYLGHFLTRFVNASDGLIITGPYINQTTGRLVLGFGHGDSDADYGRIIQLFGHTVIFSGNLSWAAEFVPVVAKMADVITAWYTNATSSFPVGHPLRGIHRGPPEADFNGDHSYFFNINVWSVRGLLELYQVASAFPSLFSNATWVNGLLTSAIAWRADIRRAANYTAVKDTDGTSVKFLHPCVGSNCESAFEPSPIQSGGSSWPTIPGTSFQHGIDGDYKDKLANYANFRFFSETLLAGVLDPDYEKAIVSYRETHHGMVMGMTRFRDHTDDMPIVGYGWGALMYDRTATFHSILAGHTANYLSRGSFGGTEQRKIYDIVDERWRNDCKNGGEDCSLCMVSSVAPSMWVRWMLVQEQPDPIKCNTGPSIIHVARGAPQRWFQPHVSGSHLSVTATPFGITNAPTRQGQVSFSITPTSGGSSGWVAIAPNPGPLPKTNTGRYFVSVHVRPAATRSVPVPLHVSVVGATVASIDTRGGTALLQVESGSARFNVTFSASWMS